MPPCFFLNAREAVLNAGWIGQIAPDLLDSVHVLGVRHIDADDLSTRGGERLRDCSADTGRGTGNENDFPFELHGSSPRNLVGEDPWMNAARYAPCRGPNPP